MTELNVAGFRSLSALLFIHSFVPFESDS